MKRILPILLTTSLLLLVTPSRADDDAASGTAATALVQTVAAEVREVPQKLEAYGSVGTAPGQQRSLTALRESEVVDIDVVVGAVVHKGAALMSLQASAEAQAAYTQARAAADAAHVTLAQDQRLFAGSLITNAQLADSQHAASDADAVLKAQEATGGAAAETVIRAPSEGVVTGIPVHSGDRVAVGAALLTFSGTQSSYAELGISPEDASQVKPGMEADMVAVFMPTAVATGKVSQVGSALDPATGLVEVLIQLSGKNVLVPGSAVSGEIVLARVKAPAVPREAVLHDDEGAYLFVVSDGKAHRVGVQTGPDDGKDMAITQGIKAGDRVVTLGNYELDDGMAVREQPR